MSKSGLNAILHGEAADVAETLAARVAARSLDSDELACALINALHRVDALEAKTDRLEAAAAAREAAAGFDPDPDRKTEGLTGTNPGDRR